MERSGGTHSPRNTARGSKRRRAGPQLNPVWKGRTLVASHLTPPQSQWAPKQASMPPSGHTEPWAQSGCPGVMQDGRVAGPSELWHQGAPMGCPPQGYGGCPQPLASLLSRAFDSQHRHQSEPLLQFCSHHLHGPPKPSPPAPQRLDSRSWLIYFSANFPELCRTNYRRSASAPLPPDTALWPALGARHSSCYFF